MENKTYQERALRFQRWIDPFCSKVEIAGSIRRGVEKPKDIEIVAVSQGLKLHTWFVNNKSVFKVEKNGQRYKRFYYDGADYDLFIVKPEDFATQYFIRTGSKEFVTKCMTAWKKKGGFVKDCVWHCANGDEVRPNSEIQIFEMLDMPYLEPSKRT